MNTFEKVVKVESIEERRRRLEQDEYLSRLLELQVTAQARERPLEDLAKGQKKNCYVFGRGLSRRVNVQLTPHASPAEMMEGMEEFMFKNCHLNLTDGGDPWRKIYLALLNKESTSFRIFKHNLDKLVDRIL